MSEGARLFRFLLAWLLVAGNPSCFWVSSNKQLIAEGVQDFSLSPDGEQVIFFTRQGLKKLSLKTGEQSLILPLTAIAPVSCWSLNNRWFAFKRINLKSQNEEICLTDLQDNRLYHLVKARRICGFALSPDGSRLAWIEEEGKIHEGKVKSSLVIGALKGGKIVNPKVLYFEERHELPPELDDVRWTPDGQFLIFRSRSFSSDGQIPRLGIIRPDGTGLLWIVPEPPPSRKSFPMHATFSIYSWAISPDSKSIAFGFGGDIWLCQIGSKKKPSRIASYTAIELCWSPNGESLLFVASGAKAPPPAPGSLPSNTPHELHWLSKDGQKHRFLWEEVKGIYRLQWRKGNEIFYLSDLQWRRGNNFFYLNGSSLWKATVPFPLP
jgi:WD40 repeat protein